MITKEQAIENNINIIDTNESLRDAKNERIAQIKALLPNVINSDNQLDIKALNDLLGAMNTTSNNQGYELTFAGKGLARAKADTPTTKELKIEMKQSKNFHDTDNVIIRGDNIDSLKILYKNYHNKIKMIYIDPPYNTKSENFVYNDNFKQSEAELIENFGLNDNTCNFLNNVYGTRSHSGWLSFIYPRLILAKELLTDDGVIFISIDDNEQANLKIICDEIFGEENFVDTICWKKKYGGGAKEKYLVSVHEYILLYSKNKINLPEILVDFDLEKARKFYKHKDENFEKLGYYRTHPLEAVKSFDLRNNLRFPVVAPDGTEVFPQRQWRWSKERFDEALQKNEVIFNKNTNNQWVLSSKQYLNNENGEQRKTKTQSLIDDIFTQQGTKEIFEILGDSKIFSFPKPSSLIKRILYFFSQQDNAVTNNDLILDFFAGSGTTAHAVMQLNAEDGGNRKFILCQWDEAIDPKTSKPAYDFCIENNFAPVISSITLERVNRAGDKIKAENKNKNIDIGYKVFSLIDKPKVNYDATHEPTFFLNRTRETALDTLVNMLVATCQTLDTKIETIKENAIYKANNEIYVTGTITADDLEGFKDLKINIDALADINLTDYMNINLNFGDNMTVIF